MRYLSPLGEVRGEGVGDGGEEAEGMGQMSHAAHFGGGVGHVQGALGCQERVHEPGSDSPRGRFLPFFLPNIFLFTFSFVLVVEGRHFEKEEIECPSFRFLLTFMRKDLFLLLILGQGVFFLLLARPLSQEEKEKDKFSFILVRERFLASPCM